MHGPSPLVPNDLPYVFTSLVGAGRVTSEDQLWDKGVAPIDRSALAGRHANQLPLDDQLVDFP